MRRVGWLLPAALAAVTLAGCSGSSSAGLPHGDHSASLVKLVDKARLAPCPLSSMTPVSGGLPNLTLNCLGDGPSVHLAGLKGPAVVNVWGSWCGPCQDEAGYLSSVYRAVRGKVTFLGVDTEDESDSALNFGTKVSPPVRYPSVVDPDKKVLIGLARAPGPPETVFVGTSGKIVHVHLGQYFSAPTLRADIATYLHVR
jgi:cytochrome c biogenesis protein CcmG, thiol:disulfide interchange protein DsbE